MTPTDIIDAAKWLGGIALAVIAFFLRRELDKVGSDLAGKADKEHMQREIEGLKMELKESQNARERDMERLERAQSERLSEFQAGMRDRLTAMERNVNDKITGMREDVSGKLDMIMQVINQLRKE